MIKPIKNAQKTTFFSIFLAITSLGFLISCIVIPITKYSGYNYKKIDCKILYWNLNDYSGEVVFDVYNKTDKNISSLSIDTGIFVGNAYYGSLSTEFYYITKNSTMSYSVEINTYDEAYYAFSAYKYYDAYSFNYYLKGISFEDGTYKSLNYKLPSSNGPNVNY